MERYFSNAFRGLGIVGSYLELGRPWNGIVTGLYAIMGIVLFGSASLLNMIVIFAIFTIAYMGGAALNDIYDRKIDEINMPYRPLQEKRLEVKHVWIFSAAMYIAALALAIILGPLITLFTVLFLIFGDVYSVPPIRLCTKSILSHFDLSFTAFLIPFYSGIVFYQNKIFLPQIDIIYFMIAFYFLFVSVFIIKDYKDVEGDRAGNKITPVLQLGPKNVRIISMLLSTVSFSALIYALSMIKVMALWSYALFALFLISMLYFESIVIRYPERGFGGTRVMILFTTLLIIFIFFG